MGQCASHPCNVSSPRYADVTNKINSPINGIIFQKTSDEKRFVNEGHPRKPTCLSDRSPTDKTDFFFTETLSRTECTRTPDTTGRPGSESSTSSVNSSTLSDSFDLADLLSFDGINKRATNRNDIGLEILKAKIHCGADPHGMYTHGERSCLMFAVIANDYDFTKNLVEQGVDVNKRTRLGETALGLATELKRDKIANFLRLKGAKK